MEARIGGKSPQPPNIRHLSDIGHVHIYSPSANDLLFVHYQVSHQADVTGAM